MDVDVDLSNVVLQTAFGLVSSSQDGSGNKFKYSCHGIMHEEGVVFDSMRAQQWFCRRLERKLEVVCREGAWRLLGRDKIGRNRPRTPPSGASQEELRRHSVTFVPAGRPLRVPASAAAPTRSKCRRAATGLDNVANRRQRTSAS